MTKCRQNDNRVYQRNINKMNAHTHTKTKKERQRQPKEKHCLQSRYHIAYYVIHQAYTHCTCYSTTLKSIGPVYLYEFRGNVV